MRADARRNYDHLLSVARDVITEQGAGASLRDIARRADVGSATLLRHFPSRDALVEALLRSDLDELTRKATQLERQPPSAKALIAWFKDGVEFFQRYRGVADLMAAADADPDSALHKSCDTLRSAGFSLLSRAQTAGLASKEVNGADFFALIAAAGWIRDQSSFEPRANHLVGIIARSILVGEAYATLTAETREP